MPAAKTFSDVTVPFVDLRGIHEDLQHEVLRDLAALIESSAFVNGPAVAEFEQAFADFCGTRFAVGLASGLDALRLALLAGGLEPGDEVLVPANTFIATFEAVTQASGRPVPVDVSESDWNMDPKLAAAAIGARTRFVMPVHLYGQLADMEALIRLGVPTVEDACQAHGATRDGIRAGAAGLAGAFSFYPAKNLGAFGDAGALVTDDEELASRVRALREHGQRAKYRHELEGYTARLDTIQALVLLRKLPLLEGWNQARRDAASLYTSALNGIGDLVLPPVPAGSEPVWHVYVVWTGDPEGLAAFLAERGIQTGRHYPEPAHLSAAYSWLGYGRGSFPVTERLCAGVLSLPIFPGISEEQVEKVASSIADYFERG
jgi:dTDP-4-amino-4,6-dideoxygalactose transaminase